MIPLKRALGAAALLVTVTSAPLAAQAAPQKFAYVNTQKILDQAPGRPEAEAVLQKEIVAAQDQLKKMNDAIVKSFTDYQSLAPTTAQAEKDRRLKLVQDRQNEMQQKQQEYEAQMAARRDELLQPLLDQIKIVLEDLRVEGGWTMIFDVAQGGAIVASDKNLDLSDRAIAKLRTMPKPVIATKPDSATRTGASRPPAGAPLNAPAGVRPPGSPTSLQTKRPDSTTAKKADSTTGKKPDSTTKRPDTTTTRPSEPTLPGSMSPGA